MLILEESDITHNNYNARAIQINMCIINDLKIKKGSRKIISDSTVTFYHGQNELTRPNLLHKCLLLEKKKRKDICKIGDHTLRASYV